MGNCPSDKDEKLACLWRPYTDCSDGCAILNGHKGIYKCVSIARCDAYYGGSACSASCNLDGKRCNGQGSCNMMFANAIGHPMFGCACDNGYSGEKCEIVPGMNTTSTDSKKSKPDLTIDRSSNDREAHGSDDGTINDVSAKDDVLTDSNALDKSPLLRPSPSRDVDVDSVSSGTPPPAPPASEDKPKGLRPGGLILIIVLSSFFLVGGIAMLKNRCTAPGHRL